MTEYPPDTFTVNDVTRCLDYAGLKYQVKHRYILTQCPFHTERNPSAQIYLNDFFVLCHAGCGRQHITKAFPELRDHNTNYSAPIRKPKMSVEKKYKQYDLYHEWDNMPLIPRNHEFKNLPLELLDELGWRWDEHKNSYFIPYFNSTKTQIPFAQWRHLSGERRFTFLTDAKPIAYGLWNLDKPKLFVCEGTSDMAVLTHCGIPAIAMPSASSSDIMKRFAQYCKDNGISIVYAGDRDDAGDKLKESLDEVMSYRVCQVPEGYKDWGDFYVDTDKETVVERCMPELEKNIPVLTDAEKIMEIMGGGTELKIKQ